MADFSGPIHRNHASSAILSKKLSNVHSFTGKSIYDDVFATSSKLKAPTFSSRVDDYAEIFNRSSSSSASSIPVLDLPDIDKLCGSGNVPSSESDYSTIFGGFNDVDIDLAEEESSETRIRDKSSPSESDTDSVEKNQVNPNDAAEQSVDGKKEFKMSYNKINNGIREGTPGTTHIAQLHAIPGFTCIIDEITPLQKTELPSTDDVSSIPGVSEAVIDQQHSRKASSSFSDSDFKDADENLVKVYDMDVNATRPKVMPSSIPTPSVSNSSSTSSSIKGAAPKDETHETDDFVSKIDESPVFSDEEVDTDSAAAASAAAVRKAIEMAQASIRLAKEAMERHKSFQSSMKHSSKKRLKVKEVRDTKMVAQVKIVSERKGLEISERELTTNQNLPCTNWQNETSGNQSEVLPVKQDRLERKGEFEAKNIHEREEIEKKLTVSHEVEIEGKFNASQEPEIFEEVLTEFSENENESTIWKSAHDDYDTVLKDSQKQLEAESKLKQAREGEQIENKLKEDFVADEKERKVNELLRHEIYERKVEEACGSLENENKPTSSSEGEVNKDNLQDAWTAKDYASEVETVHDQELRLYDFNGGRPSDHSLEEDFESKGFEKHDEAWKQEETGDVREEVGQNEVNERAEDEKNLKEAQDSLTNMEKNHQNTCNDNVEASATHNVLADKKNYMMLGATETSSEPEENEESSNGVEMTNELADTEMYGKSSLDRDAIDGDDDQITNNLDDVLNVCMIDDDKVSDTKADENEFKVEDVENEWEAKYMLETASISEDEFDQNDIENSLKEVRDSIMVDDSDLSLDEASEDSENEKIDKNNKESGISCNMGACVENVAHEFGEPSNNIKEDGTAFDQVEEINVMKAAYVDKQCVKNEKILEAAQETKTSQYTEQMKEYLQNSEEKKAKESMHDDVIVEKKQPRSRDEAKEKEREIERGRVAVERAIREARERAFVDARERAEKAAMEKVTAEAQQRLKKDVRERLDKAAAEASSLAAKVSMEAKAKAERAAVERATEEARGRALEKALSEKATSQAREQQNNGTRRTFSSDQHQGSGPSSSYKHSDSSVKGAHSPAERFDDGTKNESAERCKAKLEKHQQIVERAAKALEEKNKRDLLAQKEQAERNRFADALDSDVKRWSSGKTGNLHALLSTLQYILGTDSGWQPILLTDIVTNSAVKKAYRKATLFVHPDKLQQRRASIQQKYICEKVFDLLKDAWNKFNSEER